VADQLILVGHSLGATVVLPLADRLADRVAHVVCLAPAQESRSSTRSRS
jgi:predicted alpha/beta hydrolase family esterase